MLISFFFFFLKIDFRQKKALQVQKTPRPEPEPSPVLNPKRPKETARDAREIAKKLLKSGAIGPIKKVPNRTDQESFKRPCGMERKMLSAPQTLTSYQPFSAAPPVKTEVPDSPPKNASASKFTVFMLFATMIYSFINVELFDFYRICTAILFLLLQKLLHLLQVLQNFLPNLLVRVSLYLLEEVAQ